MQAKIEFEKNAEIKQLVEKLKKGSDEHAKCST